MNISLICVGKISEKSVKMAIAEYTKRLGPYCSFKTLEVSDEKCPENLSEKEKQQVMQKEGDRILKKIPSDAVVFTLEIDGKTLSSEKLAEKVRSMEFSGTRNAAFIIGGSLGLSPEVKKRSSFALSFGPMTYPHQLMRLILTEQLYRAFKIMKNEPYHK